MPKPGAKGKSGCWPRLPLLFIPLSREAWVSFSAYFTAEEEEGKVYIQAKTRVESKAGAQGPAWIDSRMQRAKVGEGREKEREYVKVGKQKQTSKNKRGRKGEKMRHLGRTRSLQE